MLILGIETSCDDTGAAIVADGRTILSNVVSSQIEAHAKFGGVVPEIASRKHLENILPVIERALEQAGVSLSQIDAVAVTCGPGLMGSLLVGVSLAKSLAYAATKPLIGVDHLQAHLAALELGHSRPAFPYLGLVVSGGHSNLYLVSGHDSRRQLGQTRDDAVGEAFDKVAKALGLGYPGGPVIDKLARRSGNPRAVDFPRAWLEKDSLDFSFSGLKTAVWQHIKKEREIQGPRLSPASMAEIAAGFQAAVVDVLVGKTIKAAQRQRLNRIAISGGVACNSELRKRLHEACLAHGFEFYHPSPRLCTDNAAMVAAAGYFQRSRSQAPPYSAIDAYATQPPVPK